MLYLKHVDEPNRRIMLGNFGNIRYEIIFYFYQFLLIIDKFMLINKIYLNTLVVKSQTKRLNYCE